MPGPLQGLKVVELAGIGPAPMAAMLLADLGAEVLRIERSGSAGTHLPFDPAASLLNRGKEVLCLNLKNPADVGRALDLVSGADVVVESYRPGVVERLGLGPEECMKRNPRLIYARITGWGRSGPLAAVAGHDLNYIALTGALAAIGPGGGKPAIPLNLLGDFGGGSLYLVFGILAALFERTTSGRGQVVDTAMIDGVASLMTSLYSQWAGGTFELQRASNLVDGGAPFYEVYQTADGSWVSVAAIEPKFFAELVELLDIDRAFIARQYDKSCWPELRQAFERCFRTKTRDAWCQLLETRDVCFAPVLNLEEATRHPHHVARGTFCSVNGIVQPAPSPRFDRTPVATTAAPVKRGLKIP
jgi:alpha-methylacyl-CoA racemase